MPRRSYNEGSVVATFTEDQRSARKAKYMSPASVRLASHDKTRVAYFHDEGVGNYHYGVNVNQQLCCMFLVLNENVRLGETSNETSSIDIDQSLGLKVWITRENGNLSTSKSNRCRDSRLSRRGLR